MNAIVVFTDGAARGNPGPGGWGSIVVSEKTVTELGGRENRTTNNRMELMAAIGALEYLSKLATNTSDLKATIYTDSSYVLKGATVWMKSWQKNNWRTAGKTDVVNRDLWERLAECLEALEVKWQLVKGHAGIPANERCDAIATSFADNKDMILYQGSSNSYGVDVSTVVPQSASIKSKSKSSSQPAYSYISAIDGDVKVHTTWKECEARVKGKSKALFKKSFSRADEKAIIDQWKNPFRS